MKNCKRTLAYIKYSVLIIANIFWYSNISSQNITYYYRPFFQVNKNPICIGDTAVITINSATLTSTGGGFNLILENRSYYPNAKCYHPAVSFDVTSLVTPQIIGENITSLNVIRNPECQISPTGVITIKVAPTTKTIYQVYWEASNFYPQGFPIGTRPFSENYIFDGSIEIDVVNSIPILTTNKNKVKPGEEFTLTIENCTANGITPDSSVQIKEKCEPINSFFALCSNNSFTYTAANIPITLQYNARTIRTDLPSCVSEWSDTVKIFLENESDPNACGNDLTINTIENILSNVDPNNPPDDYHYYTSIKKLDSNCDMNSVWNNYISSNFNAQPQNFDMPLELPLLGPTNKLFQDFSPQEPAYNCANYDIFSGFNSALKLAPHVTRRINPVVGGALILAIEIACPGILSSNVLADPIKIVVDNNKKCITRYTLPGHILYPGKTTTCFYTDDCGDLYVRTIGEGRTSCDGGIGGSALAKFNVDVGKKIFDNNHNRINCN